MTDAPKITANEKSSDANPKRSRKRTKKRRWLIGTGITLVTLGILFTAVVFVLPNPAAHWFLNTKLADLGLSAKGVTTVDIDLWNQEIQFGPFEVGTPDGDPVKIERFGLSFSLKDLFSRRGNLTQSTISGLTVNVSRDDKGRVLINGMDVFELLQLNAQTEAPAETREDTGTPWGVGLRSFAMRESGAHLIIAEGRELLVVVERLDLSDFESWNPDTPGKFSLTGSVNGMGLVVEGTATPFSDKIEIEAKSKLTDVGFEKIERLTGPLDLATRDGVLQADLAHKISLTTDGLVAMHHTGLVEVDGLSIAVPSGTAISMGRAEILLDMKDRLEPSGRLTATGSVAIKGREAALSLAGGGRVDLADVTLSLNNTDLTAVPGEGARGTLSATLQAGTSEARFDGQKIAFGKAALEMKLAEAVVDTTGPLQGLLDGTLIVEALEVEGPIGGTVERIAVDLSDGALNYASSTSATGAGKSLSVDLKGLALSVDAAGDRPPVTLNAASVAFGSRDFDLGLREEGLPTWRGTFDGNSQSLAAAFGSADEESVEIADLRISDAVMGSDLAGTVGRMAIKGATLSRSGAPDGTVRVAGVEAAGVTLSASRDLTLDRLSLGGVNAEILRGEGGGIALRIGDENGSADDFVLNAIALKQAGDANTDANNGGPGALIERLNLAKPVALNVTDKRQSPAVSLDATITRLELGGPEVNDPGGTLEGDQLPVALALTLNQFTKVSVEGWISQKAALPDFDLAARIVDLQLSPFSIYAAKYLGVNLETGRFSLEAKGGAVDGGLKVETKLGLRDLNFSVLDSEEAKRLSAKAGVPIETAISLLEDSEKRIDLSIPIAGDLRNPEFDLDQVISKAVGNAIVGTIGATLKLMFPPAFLVSAILSSDNGSGIKFAPAPFEPGTTDLTTKGQDLVSAVGKLLKERPKLIVTVCGRATAADLEAVLKPAIEQARVEQKAAHDRAMADYRARLQPFINRGVVGPSGKLLVDQQPETLPRLPVQAAFDPAAAAAKLKTERADALRTQLTGLASQRTRAMRLDLAERQKVETKQVSECRAVYDPEDKEAPRGIATL